ncbi:MAG: crossover junction endodeoxyribonuclease RuvC [Flavobacteriales bacterium]|nr:crossover junction endodeoxyribonuclease RuvC [Flavobacteriales bacterium]HPF89131.1 crossover junction endodeoxyribonuclease RuvC [Flavobacteriales bacterium]
MSKERRADIVGPGAGALAKSRPDAPAAKVLGERIILGIDPGTTVMGFGVLAVEGQALRLVEAGAIRFEPGDDHTLKLRAIFRSTLEIIERHLPDELAIEAQFFGKNVQSMLKLGRAQGVAIAAALQRDISVMEYAPKRVKQSITGNGNAAKEQVAAMLLSILRIADLPSSTDATDAVAVAVCHHFASQGRGSGASVKRAAGKDWSAFIRNNPDRIR